MKIAMYGHKGLFDLFRPSGPVNLEQVANALGNINRFGGNTIRPYSVAEHSIRVASLVPRSMQLQALLHDASEAFMGDIKAPIKCQINELNQIEHGLNVWLRGELGVDLVNLPQEVYDADLIMCETELRDLVQYVGPNVTGFSPLEARIGPAGRYGLPGNVWLNMVRMELEKCKK